MAENTKQESLSLLLRVSFGMGNMLNVLGVVGMWFPYANAFFTKVLGLSASQAGTIVLVAQVAGGVFAPTVGILSDMCGCSIYGRRKIFHLLGVLSFACSFFFLWHDCFGCQKKYETVYYSIIAVIFQFGYAATQISQLALVPELASSKHLKVELNSIRFGFQVAGTLLTFALLWVLLDRLPHQGSSMNSMNITNCVDSTLNEDDKEAFWVAAIIVIGLGFLMVIPFHLVVREKKTTLKKLQGYKWFIKPNFYLVICTFIAAKIITIFTQQFLTFFFLDTLNMTQMSVSIGPIVLYVASFVATLSVKRINRLIGEKMLYFIGVAFIWGSLMWFWVQPATMATGNFDWSRDRIYIAVILLGLGGATLMVLSLSMISILIGEYTGSSAFVYGWVLLIDRVSNGVLNKLVLELKDHLFSKEKSDCEIPDGEKDFFRHVIVFTPFAATALGLGAICLMALYEVYQNKKQQSLNAPQDTKVQIRDTVADRASLYSFAGNLPRRCCGCCYKDITTFEGKIQEGERKLLIESDEDPSHVSANLDSIDYELSLTI